jgi:hypothetical protein
LLEKDRPSAPVPDLEKKIPDTSPFVVIHQQLKWPACARTSRALRRAELRRNFVGPVSR